MIKSKTSDYRAGRKWNILFSIFWLLKQPYVYNLFEVLLKISYFNVYKYDMLFESLYFI